MGDYLSGQSGLASTDSGATEEEKDDATSSVSTDATPPQSLKRRRGRSNLKAISIADSRASVAKDVKFEGHSGLITVLMKKDEILKVSK